MKSPAIINHISSWLDSYCINANMKGFIIGISGGIDSAVTSTLCAMTGKKVIVVSMPIHQKSDQLERANEHMKWLCSNYQNVSILETDLTKSFDTISSSFPTTTQNHSLSMANTRARLRMLSLYAIGQSNNVLVAGTGKKIEDFGIRFFTKYGDGGVDLSPIADLTKSQIFELAKELKIIESIQVAKPTDGLWDVDRTDEDQLGATYPELEWAMEFLQISIPTSGGIKFQSIHDFLENNTIQLNPRQLEVIKIYFKFNTANKHKMEPIPVCLIPMDLK